jgi:GT2 family glycosyltransferase
MNDFQPWSVLHVELIETLPDLPSKPGLGGYFVVLWWEGVPLGHVRVPADSLPVPASQLVNLALSAIAPAVGDHLLDGFEAPMPGSPAGVAPSLDTLRGLRAPLARLREQIEVAEPATPSVSVVVCTRNRADDLQKCLQSLQGLKEAPDEIIVVDNDPSNGATRRLVEQMPGVLYVAEPRPGLSVARNAGVRHATGEIVAFTDDDVLVDPNWIRRLARGFSDPSVMVVTGLVLPAELETFAQHHFETHTSFSQGYRTKVFDRRFFDATQRVGVPVWSIGAGANMAIRRRAFELVGLFDERLGAGASGCSEDSELWYRVLAAGWTCRYEPTAVVHHVHRRDLEGLERQMYQYMRGHIAALLIQYDNHGHRGNLYRAFVALPRFYAAALLRRIWHGRRRRWSSIRHQVAGCVAGFSFYLKHRRRPRVQDEPAVVARSRFEPNLSST